MNKMMKIYLCFLICVAAVFFILTKYKRQIKELKKIQETDELTGLGNIKYLERCIKTQINDKNRSLYAMFYFYIDTDKIDIIRGKKYMNAFLCHTAKVIGEHTSERDINARVSDDGFVVLHKLSDIKAAEKWLKPILNKIKSFWNEEIENNINFVGSCIYFFQPEIRDLNDILINVANIAKNAYYIGSEYKLCTAEDLYNYAEDKVLQSQIIKGLKNKEFELYIQFYVDAFTKKTVGGEALSRWNHPEKGLLFPGRYVPLMEREEIVYYLDYYSLNKVCTFLEQLDKKGIKDFFLSCNFSRSTFSSDLFIKRCMEIIDKYSFNRKMLIFEITESTDIKDFETVKNNIIEIKKRGISIALDDFGEGFTSFFDIQEYPIDSIKLDKSLIDNIGTNPGDVIISAMIDVCHKLGIKVLAEGVENDIQAEVLKKMGCDIIQGFRFYYPIPEAKAENILISNK